MHILKVKDGEDFRVLISPLPPVKQEIAEAKKQEHKTQEKNVAKKIEKKIVKVEVRARGIDNR